ncbi:MAG: hypothetical protein J2P27_14900, partial [Actinobacteria bacterium]|nr:hypothetical protein [Actinomycetota bacterium]
MNTSESLEALRRANPRNKPGFADTVDAASAEVRFRIVTAGTAGEPPVRHPRPRGLLAGLSAAAVALAAVAVAGFVTVGSPGSTLRGESAAAAINKAVTVSAMSAQDSGTVNVRMRHDGELWTSKVIRWNGDNIAISDHSPGGTSSGSPLRVVNGILYGHDPNYEGWVNAGPVSSIDPGSGTTPAEQLTAIREDVGGATLQRMVAAMTGLTTEHQGDGSTIYSGSVPAGQIARETGSKEGQTIRVLPFGYVAHDAAADPASLLHTAVTVGSDGVIRDIAVTWGTWTYTVTYSDLGSTPP